jgi:heme exporter protein CcmD
MNHLPYIAASYGIFGLAVLYLALETAFRLRSTTRRLKALDHRKASA